MPRKPREEVESGVFHVYARGNDKRPIYSDDRDRGRYVHMLRQEVERRRWHLLAFCLMPNHVHLLIETPEANLGVGMQRFHGEYAQYFNLRHGRSGHVFQGRYGAVRVTSDEQLWTVAAYVAANPVKAGLCGAPEEWTWGSHGPIARGDSPDWVAADRLVGYFGSAGGDGRRRYLEMVRDGNDGSLASAGLPRGGPLVLGGRRN